MISQTTLYTIGFVVVIVIVLQYVSFMILRKLIRNDINKIAKNILKNKGNQVLPQNNNIEDNEESVDIDTPTHSQNNKNKFIKNNDHDSYVNPIPSIDNDNKKDEEQNNEDDDEND